jgi:hypothetical protein
MLIKCSSYTFCEQSIDLNLIKCSHTIETAGFVGDCR